MLKKVAAILLVLLWMFVIFSFSNQKGEASGGASDEVLINVLEHTTSLERETNEMDELVETLSFPIRKCAHFLEYFILAFLIVVAFSVWGIDKHTIIITSVICILYAITDEIHQFYIAGRSAQVSDVFLDSSASLLSTLLFYKLIIKRGHHAK